MSENSHASMANLELCRELYTEPDRQRFYTDYQAALDAEQLALAELEAHWENRPTTWQFWKKPPEAWKLVQSQLLERYRLARNTLDALAASHPLLVRVFGYKRQPLN